MLQNENKIQRFFPLFGFTLPCVSMLLPDTQLPLSSERAVNTEYSLEPLGMPGWHMVNGMEWGGWHTPETSDHMSRASSSSLCGFRDDNGPSRCSKILFFKIHIGSVSAYIFSSNSPVIHKCSFCSSEVSLLQQSYSLPLFLSTTKQFSVSLS